MSFGFGVGDFIAVIELSMKIWNSCKDSTDEYRSIGKDVRQTYLILTAIQRYWQIEKDNGHEIMMADQTNLKEMEQICHGTLQKIEAELSRHKGLGTRGSMFDRMKWFGNAIGPLRTSLQNSNYQMAMFNTTLVATNASSRSEEQLKLLRELKDQGEIQKAEQHMRLLKELKDQGKILDIVMKQYQQIQEGTSNKPPPAYSQMTAKDFEEDEDTKWPVIRNDLKETGLDDSELQTHMPFIMDWIETVNSDKAALPNHLESVDESTEVPPSNQNTGRTKDSSAVVADPSSLAGRADQTFPLHSSAVPPVPSPVYFQRPTSADTHRSQSSTWRDPSLEGNVYAVKMVAKVLKSKYGEDHDELYILPIKRAYHYVDYSGDGILSREEVQNVCRDAAFLAGVNFTEAEMAAFVRKMDKNHDHDIDCEEFIETVIKLRDYIFEVTYNNSQVAARVNAGVVLQIVYKNEVDKYIIPFGWSYKYNYPSQRLLPIAKRVWEREFTHDVVRPAQMMPPLQLNLAAATHVATKFCATQIANVRSLWRSSLVNMTPADAAEYNSALSSVARAVAKFHLLDPDGPSPGWVLDSCLDEMQLIPLELFDELKAGPVEDLLALRKEIWDLLDPILGFVWNLKPAHQKIWVTSSPDQIHLNVSTIPPALSEWRRLRMTKFSALIDAAASKWTGIEARVMKCVEWNNKNKAKLFMEVNDALTETKSLYEAQRQANTETQYEITIETVQIENLSREGLRHRYPKLYFKVTVDGSEDGYASETHENTASPIWSFDKPCKGKRDSTIQLDFHRGESWEYEFTKAAKTLIGTYKFEMKDVTNFDGKSSKITSTGFLEKVSKLGLSKDSKQNKVTVVVNTSDSRASDEMWENQEGGLPAEILKRPIPSDWEVRRTKEDDIYFFNKSKNKPTSSFWRDPTAKHKRPSLPEPLPPGWRLAHHGAKLLYHHIGQSGYEGEATRPEVDDASVFEGVLRCKTFDQIGEFFSQQYLLNSQLRSLQTS